MPVADDVTCRGLRLARDATRRQPAPPMAEIAARVRVGSFLRALPATPEATRRLASLLFAMAMEVDARWLDTPPRVETAYGEVPVLRQERCELLAELHGHQSGHGGDDGKLFRAAVALNGHLENLQQTWEAKLLGVWRSVRQAEEIASDLYSAHLTRSLWTARDERSRYLYPDSALPRTSSADFAGLASSVVRIAATRSAVDLDAMRTEQTVVTAVTMALTVIAVGSALQRGALTLDRQAWNQIDYANGLSAEAARHTAEATTRYLQVLREEAAKHPVVLVLQHTSVSNDVVTGLGRAVDRALVDAEQAIASLRAHGANAETVPERRTPQDLTCSGLAKRLAEASRTSAWKMPVFVERALLEMPPDRARDVVAVMRLAAEVKGGEAIGHSLAMFGLDTAAMLAPATGPIGIGLALAWGLFNLGKSIHEYEQLSDLFHATLDPAAVFLGLDHEEASKVGVVMDLLGLLVW